MTPRIAILDRDDNVLGFMDNSLPDAMHYHDEELHTYLPVTACTFDVSVDPQHPDSNLFEVGGKLAWVDENGSRYVNIISIDQTEDKKTITGYGLTLELSKEETPAFKADSAHSLEWYIQQMSFDRSFSIGLNEVADKTIKCEWTGSDTIIKRLSSLATNFSAEFEFIPKLNPDYSLADIKLNIYRKHSDSDQGMGRDRKGTVLRYGHEITEIRKKTDISDLFTAIRVTGKDGLTLSGLAEKKEYDSNGRLEFIKPSGNTDIYAIQARDRFPSTSLGKENGRYILKRWDYQSDDLTVLYGQALGQLKKLSAPEISFEVDGYIDAGLGDCFTIEDSQYKPTLYVQARVIEQIISYTDPAKNKTKFDNYTEVHSQISDSLTDRVNELIRNASLYNSSIVSAGGTIIKTDTDVVTLSARVYENGHDVTNDFSFRWYKDGTYFDDGTTFTVSGSEVSDQAVFSFEAVKDGSVKSYAETTVTRLTDGMTSYVHIAYASNSDGTENFSFNPAAGLYYMGQYSDFSPHDSTDPTLYKWILIKGADGADAIVLYIDSSNGTQFKNTEIATTLTVSIIYGEQTITDSTALHETFGNNATLQWQVKKMGETSFSDISSIDPRITDHGFIFTISAADVQDKAVFNCQLIF